ncbi:Histone acetyltransferase [Dispira simplex]|nr:Histone acetyltransferase [Dispira simplex]
MTRSTAVQEKQHDASAENLAKDKTSEPDSTPPNEKDTMVTNPTVDQVKVGWKVFVQRFTTDSQKEYRKAEILSIRTVKQRSTVTTRASKNATTEPSKAKPGETLQYYVHYCEFNKRLDEWIKPERIDLTRGIELPKVKRPRAVHLDGSITPGRTPKAPRKGGRGPSALARESHNAGTPSATGDTSPPSQTANGSDAGTPKAIDTTGGPDNEEGEGDETEVDHRGRTFSKKKELEKLRTSGSMTQCISEISRVKNLNRLIIGKHEVEAWYFSPYPPAFAHADTVYICEFCFSYFISARQLERHCMHCTLLHPPGNEIYRQDDLSFYEIDGRKQKLYCRNLCLISKCFLDHKTLYYDVDPFLFYVMTVTDEHGAHVIGYFSKEKESLDNYNLACILTLPQYQRKGYGRLLIAFSYELSKAEGKMGSPEKPLSDLGLLSYRAFWSETLVEKLIHFKGEVSIEELSHMTSFTTQDILHTLQSIDALKYYRGQHIICLNDSVIESYYKSLKKNRRTINPQALQWKPPHFTAAELRYI